MTSPKSIVFIGIFLSLLGAFLFYKLSYKKANSEKELAFFLNENTFQNGDIIFQTSLSNQSQAIQLATNSKYSHCGIIYEIDNQFFVFEAIQPVQLTPLENWIARGENEAFVLKRLKNSAQVLTPDVLQAMKTYGETFIGKNYDLAFHWSDNEMYCSELVWKIYYTATGIAIGELNTLGSFDIENPIVQAKLIERYGNSIPLNEPVIAPSTIFESKQLETVIEK